MQSNDALYDNDMYDDISNNNALHVFYQDLQTWRLPLGPTMANLLSMSIPKLRFLNKMGPPGYPKSTSLNPRMGGETGSAAGNLKMYSGSSSTSSAWPRRSIALILDWTRAARLALNLNLSMNACRQQSTVNNVHPVMFTPRQNCARVMKHAQASSSMTYHIDDIVKVKSMQT